MHAKLQIARAVESIERGIGEEQRCIRADRSCSDKIFFGGTFVRRK